MKAAHDAHMRFRRTVHGTVADAEFGPIQPVVTTPSATALSTQALLDGVSTLEVSKIVGTSLPMIEKYYGHLVFDRAAERLAKVQIV